jgi:hypothetical protein
VTACGENLLAEAEEPPFRGTRGTISAMGQKINRRRHQRSQVGPGAIAALNDTKIGTVENISRGGLAFRYIGFENEEEDFLVKESPRVSIVNLVGLSLHNLPCKIVAVVTSPPEYPFSSIRNIMCHLQFVRLTPEQKSQLDYFIAYSFEQPPIMQ